MSKGETRVRALISQFVREIGTTKVRDYPDANVASAVTKLCDAWVLLITKELQADLNKGAKP